MSVGQLDKSTAASICGAICAGYAIVKVGSASKTDATPSVAKVDGPSSSSSVEIQSGDSSQTVAVEWEDAIAWQDYGVGDAVVAVGGHQDAHGGDADDHRDEVVVVVRIGDADGHRPGWDDHHSELGPRRVLLLVLFLLLLLFILSLLH